MQSARGGYTIIELLIVLTVSVALFFAAVTVFSGKQGKTQFSQAMQDVRSRLQSIVNDVGASVFPESSSYNCTLGVGQRPVLSDTDAATGTNEDCIFLGKAVRLGSSQDTNKLDQLVVYTVLGARAPNGNLISSLTASNFTDANPEPIVGPSPINLTETYKVPYSAEILSAHEDTNFGAETDLMGFYNGQQSAEQGSLSLLTLGYVGLTSKNNPSAASQSIDSIRSNAPFAGRASRAWTICFQSGTSDEKAQIIVSASTAGISANIKYANCS